MGIKNTSTFVLFLPTRYVFTNKPGNQGLKEDVKRTGPRRKNKQAFAFPL
jgi:hypothetical protein